MKIRRLAQFVWGMVSIATALSLTACSGDTNAGSSSSSTESVKPAAATGPAYSTKFFTTPLDVQVPSWLGPTPDEDTANFVTFASSDESRALRILHPVVVYPPGSSEEAPVPKDYVSYLLGQANNGAKFTDVRKASVDGRRATVVTARTSQSLDGSLGCPGTGIVAEDCYGLQPEFILRMAAVSTDSGPLLIWLRLNAEDKPDLKAEARRFDQFLQGVRFSNRPAETEAPTPTPTVADPLQGTWQSKVLTERQIVQAFVAAGGTESEGHAFFAQLGGGAQDTVTFRLVFENGDVDEFDSPDGGTYVIGDHNPYRLDGKTVIFGDPGCETIYTVKLKQDTLRLVQRQGCPPHDIPYGKTIYGSFPFARVP